MYNCEEEEISDEEEVMFASYKSESSSGAVKSTLKSTQVCAVIEVIEGKVPSQVFASPAFAQIISEMRAPLVLQTENCLTVEDSLVIEKESCVG